jgi:hypothetical protein
MPFGGSFCKNRFISVISKPKYQGVNAIKTVQAIIVEIKKSRQRELDSKRDFILNKFGIKPDLFWFTSSNILTIENLWDD